MTDKLIQICPEDELQEGAFRIAQLDKTSILVCRSDSEIFAVTNECSHAFQCLEGGIIRSGWIACPAHGARFDLATGEPINPPATAPIETHPITIIDGMIFVDASRIA